MKQNITHALTSIWSHLFLRDTADVTEICHRVGDCRHPAPLYNVVKYKRLLTYEVTATDCLAVAVNIPYCSDCTVKHCWVISVSLIHSMARVRRFILMTCNANSTRMNPLFVHTIEKLQLLSGKNQFLWNTFYNAVIKIYAGLWCQQDIKM